LDISYLSAYVVIMADINLNKLEKEFADKAAREALCSEIAERYADGESLVDLAKEKNYCPERLRELLRLFLDKDEYEAAKTENAAKRLSMRITRHRHIESKADNIIEKRLATLNAESLSVKDLRGLAAISSLMADKANLAEGKATARIETVGDDPTEEELEEFWKRKHAAGTGIDIESVGA
jgi:hypothetical protein